MPFWRTQEVVVKMVLAIMLNSCLYFSLRGKVSGLSLGVLLAVLFTQKTVASSWMSIICVFFSGISGTVLMAGIMTSYVFSHSGSLKRLTTQV
jgi:hypothetical protein